MTHAFVPKFYPKTITPTTYHYILASVGIIYAFSEFFKYDYKTHNLKSPVDWHHKIYKKFDFDAYKPFFQKQQINRNQKIKEYNKNLSLVVYFKRQFYKLREKYNSKISNKEKQNFEKACINNYKNVDVKDYYIFLKFVIEFKRNNSMKNSKIVYKIWRECDIDFFLKSLLEIDIQEFYDEIHRIKENYIEYLI